MKALLILSLVMDSKLQATQRLSDVAGRQRRFFSLELFLLKDNSGILNIEALFWFVLDEIEWLTPKF